MAETLFLTSRLLAAEGVIHGFSLRTGGVSTGPLESLNLGRGVGDDADGVEENLRRLAGEAGLPGPQAFASAYQVHGDRVVGASQAAALIAMHEIFPATESRESDGSHGIEADAVVALEPGIAASVRVADCVPVLLFAPERGIGAAVHSGWRGTRLSIAGRGVRALQHVAGANPKTILAAIGPSIGRCCYEVSRDLADRFEAYMPSSGRYIPYPAVADERGVVHVPPRSGVAIGAGTIAASGGVAAVGVRPERIEQVPGCTSCDRSAFFSHRRDQGRTGRHLAFVATRS